MTQTYEFVCSPLKKMRKLLEVTINRIQCVKINFIPYNLIGKLMMNNLKEKSEIILLTQQKSSAL
jgi:hypothetical protein